jgi:octaheme c-type cytochrome (tetrathionate reductase family)
MIWGTSLLFAETPASEESVKVKADKALTADHRRFPELQKKFITGVEVTRACVGCHNLAAEQFKKTMHWTWNSPENKQLGKGAHSMNNYCISTNNMNDPACLNCHTAWDAKGVDGEVNCLVCHSRKLMNWAEAFSDIEGLEADPGDEESLMYAEEIRSELTQSISLVGPTQKENCGKCHFKGGGGEAVKHGDLDSTLLKATRSLDVHMAAEGPDFTCSRCHTTREHHISGRMYETPAVQKQLSLIEDDTASKIACVACHTNAPHRQSRLNNHTRTVSCQACHIPDVAREEPTMVAWDWSTAGKTKDGMPYSEESEFGHHFYAYKSIKGSFQWKKNLKPEYHWYNGSMEQMTFDDEIDPTGVVRVNHPKGLVDDGVSKIHPFKTMRSVLPYDSGQNRLVAPLLSTDEGYWKTLDWPSAIAKGMELQGMTFSGKMGFVSTEFSYSLNHMIAPKEAAVSCQECHEEKGRMAGIGGLYIPGRDKNPLVDGVGMAAVGGAMFMVAIHSLLRFVGKKRQKKQKEASHG